MLLKNRLWHRCFQVSFAKFLRIPFFTEHFWATASKQVTVPLQGLQTAKPLISSCRRTGKTILSNYWQNPKLTATAHYFIIILIITITIITFITIAKCIFTIWKIPSISTEFCLLFTGIFLLSYHNFHFLRPVKGVRISLQPSDIF